MKKLTKLLAMLLAVAMILSVLAGCNKTEPDPTEPEATGEPAAENTQITILGTTDLHGNVWGFSYEDNAETDADGMARVYTYVQEVRAENPNTILTESGDFIQGTIMTDDLFNKFPEKEHPVVAAMNFMGYDAITAGNHEFNWGITNMQTILGRSNAPVLAANVKDANGELVTGAGWTIVDRAGVKVAIIGVVTPNVPVWDGGKEGIDDCTYEAANVAVKNAIAEIGDEADILVVSAHMGLEPEFDTENGSDGAYKILEDCPEIDVLQVGHYHVTVNEKIGDTIVVGGRNAAKEVSRIDLTLDADKNIVDAKVEIVPMEGYEPNQEVRDLIKDAHEAAISYIQDDVVGSAAAKFQPEDEVSGIPQGWLEDTAVLDLINKIQMETAQADVSACALFKVTSDLPEGELNYGNVFDIYKFDNTLYRVTVTGAELKAYMEWSVSYYNQWQEGDVTISFNPDQPSYLYDVFAGVDYEIDLSKPVGERIQNVMFKGEPLTDDQTLTLAVNNYRFSSALKSKGLVAGDKEWESSGSIRDMIVAYLAENSPVSPEVDNNWKIVGVDLQLNNPERDALIADVNAKIASGEMETPYYESLRLE